MFCWMQVSNTCTYHAFPKMLFPVIFCDYNDLSVHVHGLFEWTLGNPTKKKNTLFRFKCISLISRDRWSNLQPPKCLLTFVTSRFGVCQMKKWLAGSTWPLAAALLAEFPADVATYNAAIACNGSSEITWGLLDEYIVDGVGWVLLSCIDMRVMWVMQAQVDMPYTLPWGLFGYGIL